MFFTYIENPKKIRKSEKKNIVWSLFPVYISSYKLTDSFVWGYSVLILKFYKSQPKSNLSLFTISTAYLDYKAVK